MDLSFLPHINAGLNGLAALLLLRGRFLIRAGRIEAHRLTMLAAFAVSSLFLASYLTHKASRSFENTTFHAEGAAKLAVRMKSNSPPRPSTRLTITLTCRSVCELPKSLKR